MAQYFSALDVRTHFDRSLEPSLRSSDTSKKSDVWKATKIIDVQFCIRDYDCHTGLTYILSLESYSIVTMMLLVAYYEHIFTSLFQTSMSQAESKSFAR